MWWYWFGLWKSPAQMLPCGRHRTAWPSPDKEIWKCGIISDPEKLHDDSSSKHIHPHGRNSCCQVQPAPAPLPRHQAVLVWPRGFQLFELLTRKDSPHLEPSHTWLELQPHMLIGPRGQTTYKPSDMRTIAAHTRMSAHKRL